MSTCPSQTLARAIGVDLDPVAVRVGEVERLADEVVGEAGERHPVAGRVREPAGEVGALGQQEGEVEEAGVADRGPRARLLVQDEQLAPAGAERGPAVAPRSSTSSPIAVR